MISKETKSGYIDLINKANVSGLFQKELARFVETYDGTNELEFKTLILALITILSSYSELAIDSEALKKIQDMEEDFNIARSELRADYKTVQSGKPDITYPVPSGPSSP